MLQAELKMTWKINFLKQLLWLNSWFYLLEDYAKRQRKLQKMIPEKWRYF